MSLKIEEDGVRTAVNPICNLPLFLLFGTQTARPRFW